eukprot:COSAG01_NODE_15013_length_1385_cov_1.798600_1_plen_92_part_00
MTAIASASAGRAVSPPKPQSLPISSAPKPMKVTRAPSQRGIARISRFVAPAAPLLIAAAAAAFGGRRVLRQCCSRMEAISYYASRSSAPPP